MSRTIDPTVWDCWRERLRRFESCDLTVAAFCQAEGFSQAGFYQWRKKLGNRSGSDSGAKQKHSKRSVFVPVVPTSLASAVVVTLANGVRVELSAGDHELVGHVVLVAASTATAGGDS